VKCGELLRARSIDPFEGGRWSPLLRYPARKNSSLWRFMRIFSPHDKDAHGLPFSIPFGKPISQ
jgi:hypothetical protein